MSFSTIISPLIKWNIRSFLHRLPFHLTTFNFSVVCCISVSIKLRWNERTNKSKEEGNKNKKKTIQENRMGKLVIDFSLLFYFILLLCAALLEGELVFHRLSVVFCIFFVCFLSLLPLPYFFPFVHSHFFIQHSFYYV